MKGAARDNWQMTARQDRVQNPPQQRILSVLPSKGLMCKRAQLQLKAVNTSCYSPA